MVAAALSRTPMSDTVISVTPESQPFIFTAMTEDLIAIPSCEAQTERHIPVDDSPADDSYLFHPKFHPRG